MDTVVITGTKRGNLFTDAANPSKVAADGANYVTFNLLKDDGTVQSNPSYYLPRTAFKALGADDLAATLKIGYSYDVVTKDDYTTLLYSKENDTVVVDQDALKGGDKDHRKDVTINSDAYKAVVSYSVLGNHQGTKTTNDYEVILYNGLGTNTALGSPSYLRDADLNIVDKDGKIILTYFRHTLTGSSIYPDGVYLVETSADSGVYRDPADADWEKAHDAYLKVYPLSTATLYQAITDTFVDITNVNAYSDTILIDDDGNSDYDRGIYFYYSFGYISTVDKDGAKQLKSDGIPGDGRLEAAKTAYTDVAYIDIDKYFNGDEDYVIKAEDVLGKYCLYAYNAKTNVFYLKDTYETKIGYVTTVNKPAKTITFDQVYFGYNAGNITGTTYKVGVDNLPGGNWNSVLRSYTDFDTLKGRTVNYVVDEKYSAILRIVDYGNDAGYVVIKDSVASLNTNGYANVLAYVNSNVASVITVASVDGYTNVTGGALVNNYLKAGDLFKATKDALGMYHLTYIDPSNFTYYAADAKLSELGLNFTNGVAYTDAQKQQTINIVDGKPTATRPTAYYDNFKGVAVPFDNFKTTKDTVIILVSAVGSRSTQGTTTTAPNYNASQLVNNGNIATLNFETSKGVPQDGSHITLFNAFDGDNNYWTNYLNNAQPAVVNSIKGARIFAATHVADGETIADFVYVVDGSWGGNIAINPSTTQSYLDSNDTIIYVDAHTMESMVATNQTSTGLGVSIGTVYQYTNAIDFIRGGLTSAYTSALYNQRLYAGHFYYVKDGYVVGEVEVGATSQLDPTQTYGRFDVEVVKVSYVDKYVSIYQQWNGYQGSIPNGTPLWSTSFGKPIVYELGHNNYDYNYVGKDVYITYKDGAPKNIVDDFAKIVNGANSYATAYVYTGNLSGTTYSGQKRIFITTTYTKGADLSVVKDLGTTITGASSAYNIGGTAVSGTGVAVYQITAEQYAALSAYAANYNNNWNDQYAGIGTTMKLYNGAVAVKDFTDANINVDTWVEQRIGNEYYLCIELKAGKYVTVAADPAYLVFTNPDNTNESYKIELKAGISITQAAPAPVVPKILVPIDIHVKDVTTPLAATTYKVYQDGKEITYNKYDAIAKKYITEIDLNGGAVTVIARNNNFLAQHWYWYTLTEITPTMHDIVTTGKTEFVYNKTDSTTQVNEIEAVVDISGVSKDATKVVLDFSEKNPATTDDVNVTVKVTGTTFDYTCSELTLTKITSVVDLYKDFKAATKTDNSTTDAIYYYKASANAADYTKAGTGIDMFDETLYGYKDADGNWYIDILVVEPFKVVPTFNDVQSSLSATLTQAGSTVTKVDPRGGMVTAVVNDSKFEAGKTYAWEVGDNYMKTDIAYASGTVTCTTAGTVTVTFDPSNVDLLSVVLNFVG